MTLQDRTDKKGKLKEVIEIGAGVFRRELDGERTYCYYAVMTDTYEVFMKTKHKTDSEFSGAKEGHERYPSSEAFGSWGWSYTSREKAVKRFESLEHGLI